MFLLRSPPYSDHTDVFAADSTAKLSEHTGINDHPINLVDDKRPSYALPSHPLPLRTLFIRKMDDGLRLYV